MSKEPNNGGEQPVPTPQLAASAVPHEKTKYEAAAETRSAIMSATEGAGPVLEANNVKRERPYTVRLPDGTVMVFN